MSVADSPSPDLAAALERLAAGDLSARDRILELSIDRLRLLARRMLGRYPAVRRWDQTDDVLSGALMRLHRTLGALRPGSSRSLMALAVTALKRELLDLARHHAGPRSYAANHDTNAGADGRLRVEAAGAVPEEEDDRWTAFHDAIAALPEAEREVFGLVWYLGADQRRIAEVVGCCERTVKSRWRDARLAVRQALDGRPPA